MSDKNTIPLLSNSSSSDDDQGTKVLTNWMKNVQTKPAKYVNANTIQDVQNVVKDTVTYPSPVRPAGMILSPTPVLLNDGGTTVQLTNLNTIHGLKEIIVPGGGGGNKVTCIDTDCGATLRQLQIYAHKHNLEVPFSAEIGFATIGGTAFTTTKDSAIGSPPIPGMGIGDVGSCIYGVTIVDENGKLKEYSVINEETGEFDMVFQGLLDSCGARGIAVRMLVTTRPKTRCTTTVHLLPRKDGKEVWVAKKLLSIRTRAALLEGNMFSIVGWNSGLIWVEERVPSANKWQLAPLSLILAPIIVRLKKFLIQRSIIPFWCFLFRIISGTFLLRFKQPSRSPGNRYDLDVPKRNRRLTFSYYSFPLEHFQEIVSEGLAFTGNYEKKYNFAPSGFAIYFVTHSGKRLAGPYGGEAASRTVGFSFDPIYHDPCDPEWETFVDAFNTFAKEKDGRPALNQTLGLEKDVEYGGTAVYGTASKRFVSPWLKQFFDARREGEVGFGVKIV